MCNYNLEYAFLNLRISSENFFLRGEFLKNIKVISARIIVVVIIIFFYPFFLMLWLIVLFGKNYIVHGSLV
jgi:hypothetical protein